MNLNRVGQSLELSTELAGRAEISYAEPDLLQHLPARRRPSDPFYGRQWQCRNDGSNGGQVGADANLEAAWDLTTGTGTRVAIIDNGMDVGHPDLAAAISGGGYFEDDLSHSDPFVPFVANDKSFPPGDHGTFCMGIAGARGDNGIGVVGGAPSCALMPVACLSDQVGSQTTLARAIAYSAHPRNEDANAPEGEGAHVISCSLGPNSETFLMTSLLRDAIDFAVTEGRSGLGTAVFWAVNNFGFSVSKDQVCSDPNTIAVGRSNRLDYEDGSAFGPELDFIAPGAQVYSTKGEGKYGHGTGTSYAAPLAASVAALLLAREPGLSWQQVRDRLRDSCRKVGPDPYAGPESGGRNDLYGFGRIDAAAALGVPSVP